MIDASRKIDHKEQRSREEVWKKEKKKKESAAYYKEFYESRGRRKP